MDVRVGQRAADVGKRPDHHPLGQVAAARTSTRSTTVNGTPSQVTWNRTGRILASAFSGKVDGRLETHDLERRHASPRCRRRLASPAGRQVRTSPPSGGDQGSVRTVAASSALPALPAASACSGKNSSAQADQQGRHLRRGALRLAACNLVPKLLRAAFLHCSASAGAAAGSRSNSAAARSIAAQIRLFAQQPLDALAPGSRAVRAGRIQVWMPSSRERPHRPLDAVVPQQRVEMERIHVQRQRRVA